MKPSDARNTALGGTMATVACLGFVLIVLCSGPTAAATPSGEPVSVRFDVSQPGASPFPSDLYTVFDASNLTFRRIDLPKPDCSTQPSACADIDTINTLDGFSTQPRITVPFTGAIDPATVSSDSVYLLNLGDTLTGHGLGERVGVNQVVWDPASNTLAFESDELLKQHSRYLLVVTDGIHDASGRPIRRGHFDALIKHPELARGAAPFVRELRDQSRVRSDPRNRVVALSLFTTQSITADLEKISSDIGRSAPQPIDFMLGNRSSGAPVRAVFDLTSLNNVLFTAQTGTAPTFAAPAPVGLASLKATIPGAVALLAFGEFTSPNYETADGYIPATPTLSGHPQPLGTNRLVLELFVPAGAKPPQGWPVVIFNHGNGGSIYAGGPWRVAAMLASQGLATIAINAVGNGGGPLGFVTVQRTDGPDVVIGAGGRGIDQDGNGTIGGTEGSRAAPPRLLIGNRDELRQTAIDTMQLVRQIEVGMDIDGDGSADLDPTRIYVLGQSVGALHAAMLLGIDPSVRAGVLNVVGGSVIETNRLAPLVRPALGAELASRVPSLINVASPSGTEFDENIPLRNLPPVTNAVAGAMALAQVLDAYQWVQQSGNPAAYAPFIREHPLPGRTPRPVLVQMAKGDQTHPNPTNTAVLRAGALADRATFYRNDLAYAANPAVPKDPHRFLTGNNVPATQAIALAAQRQIAIFLATDGATTIDPDDSGPFFETPIPLPLPETLDFIP